MRKNHLLYLALGCIWCLFALHPIEGLASTQAGGKVHVVRDVEPKFQHALADYKAGKYDAAYTQFLALVNANLVHQRMTASLLMTGKALYHLGKYSEAFEFLDRLIERYPMSRYVDDAYYARATCHYRLNEPLKAAKELLRVLNSSSDKKLLDKSRKFARVLLRRELTLSELRELADYATGEHASALLSLELARKEFLFGSTEKAVSILSDFKKKYSTSVYVKQVDQLLKEFASYDHRSVRVGVILPLTGIYAEEGLGILRGIKFAQMEHDNHQEPGIKLLLQDSKSSMIHAVQAVRKFAREAGVSVILGELESEITAGIGALASMYNIPVLAPAATENELTSVGELVFQLNSDLERKGEALAQYAIETLGLKTFATLAPADEYGQQIIASFTAKVDELGGRIIAQSWYYGETQDFSSQFKIIRQAAFHYDSTDVRQILKVAREEGKDMEELDIPVESIDAIFLPVYTEDIKYVAPQLALHNIRAQILGGEYWDNLEVLKTPQIARYVNGVIFVSDYFPDEDNRQFRNFRTSFRLKMGRTPERWEVFGYDAFRVLQEVVSQGAKTAGEIAEKLNNLEGYEGIKGKITLKGHHRVNKEVNVLQFINDRVIKLK